ncbi:LOW QUALITY PROTEIN: hypothetical protein QYF61_025626 [Mycteria americana]|uniref:Uncharacterized protein n=1 Tax=Mycteria americana TaxID=33587 RepID=A0AAN7NZL0_MYCAM|nr:LOW QUALITY PROTEIN: hypothetical protein QYF61_025626 [Mycteria americana]
MKFNKDKCKVLQLVQHKSPVQGLCVAVWDLCGWGAALLKGTWRSCVLLQQQRQIGSCIHKGITSRDRVVITTLYSALASSGVLCPSSSHKSRKMQTDWRGSQRGATKMIKGLENLPYEERLKDLDNSEGTSPQYSTVLKGQLQRQLRLQLHNEPRREDKGASCTRRGFISIQQIKKFLQTFTLPPIIPVSKAFCVKVNNKKQSSADLQFLALVIRVTTLLDTKVLWRAKGLALSPEATILNTPSKKALRSQQQPTVVKKDSFKGGYRGSFCEKLPLRPITPMPAGSKTDLPLAKAKPISNSDTASGITYLRRGKNPNCCTAAAREE